MVEYEVKFQADDFMFSKVTDGLSHIGTKRQCDTYYDTPNHVLFLNAVFLRKRDDKVIDIKYNFDKSDISHLFCNEDRFNFPLSKESNNSLSTFLSQLIQCRGESGDAFKRYQLDEFVVINKCREIYRGDDVEVSFDIVDNLGKYVEIEARTEKGIDYINNLLIKENIQRIKTGYVELYLKQYNYELYQKGKYLV